MSKRKYQMWHTDYFSVRMPIAAVEECYHIGACDVECEQWAQKLAGQLALIPREQKIRYLRETGTWTEEELINMAVFELDTKLVWLGAADLQEFGEET